MLTILVVNYNSAHHILELIDSLRKSSYKFFKILIVDNASTDDSIEILKHLKTIKLIKNKENLGFTGGINEGFKHIKTKYTLILNPDTIIEQDTIENLINLAEEKNADFVGGTIQGFKKTYSYSGGKMNMLTGLASQIKIEEPRELEENEYIDAIMILTRTESFKKLMYDENYFMYGETFDLIKRAQEQNMKIFIEPKAKIYHKIYGSTKGKKTPRAVFYLARNRFIYMKKFSEHYYLFLLIQIPIFIMHFIKYLLTKPLLLPSLIKGYIHGILQK